MRTFVAVLPDSCQLGPIPLPVPAFVLSSSRPSSSRLQIFCTSLSPLHTTTLAPPPRCRPNRFCNALRPSASRYPSKSNQKSPSPTSERSYHGCISRLSWVVLPSVCSILVTGCVLLFRCSYVSPGTHGVSHVGPQVGQISAAMFSVVGAWSLCIPPLAFRSRFPPFSCSGDDLCTVDISLASEFHPPRWTWAVRR